MSVGVELDPVFRQALRFLHSSKSDAAENIRKALDDVIKQKHGPSKMLVNTLHKKFLAEESTATGSGVIKSVSSHRRSSHKSSDSSSNNSNSSPVQIITTTTTSSTPTTTVLTTDLSGQTQEIPVIISLPDSAGGTSITAVDDNAMDTNIHSSLLEEINNLVCVVCRSYDFTAGLIECTRCHSLYHQECHNPQIKSSDLADGKELAWLCHECKGSSTTNSVSSSSSSNGSKKEKDKGHSSSSSKSKSSSSSSSSSRHHSSHHSSTSHHSSHSSKHERSSGSNSEKSSSSKNSAP